MSRLPVNPTRMELTNISRRLKTASRGHKLLKDKQDELMRQFITLSKDTVQKRKVVNKRIHEAMKAFAMAKASLPEPFIEELFVNRFHQVEVFVDVESIMSVEVPKFHFQVDSEKLNEIEYGFMNSSADLDESIYQLQKVWDDLLQVSQMEKQMQLLANNIEKTRRRVNALEHMTIPQLEETIVYIRMKLEENERSNIVRMIKVKEMN